VRTEARRELPAGRAAVWAFLAEPYHLSDWWPGVAAVQPDRRGFAPGARWQLRGTRWTNPFTGRQPMEQLLVVRAIEPYERFAFHLVADRLDVEVALAAVEEHRTLATVSVEGQLLLGGRRTLARSAAARLGGLVQTAG
jgi:uncharacterized protein YndB with AHSA1/START domain